MPKSSIATPTPSSRTRRSTCSVCCTSSISAFSVISSSRWRGSSPVSRRMSAIRSSIPGTRNWRRDTLTEIGKLPRPARSQTRFCVQAVRSTHSPIGSISPLLSASGMKSAGEIMPRSGWCQRISASAADQRALPDVDLRLVVERELVAVERLAQHDLELHALEAGAAAHLGRVELELAAAVVLHPVQRHVGAAQEAVGGLAVVGEDRRRRCSASRRSRRPRRRAGG